MVVFRDTSLVIVQTSEKIIYPEFGCPEDFFFEEFFKRFFLRNQIPVHLSFLRFVFIWLLISIYKLLSDHLLTYSKQEKGTFNF
jgi:hypothetical protein